MLHICMTLYKETEAAKTRRRAGLIAVKCSQLVYKLSQLPSAMKLKNKQKKKTLMIGNW